MSKKYENVTARMHAMGLSIKSAHRNGLRGELWLKESPNSCCQANRPKALDCWNVPGEGFVLADSLKCQE